MILNGAVQIQTRLMAEAAKAADRWEARTATREARAQSIADGNCLQADSPARVAKRLQRLAAESFEAAAARGTALAPALAAKLRRARDAAPEDLDEELVQEAIQGARNFLSVDFLERGLAASRSVGRVVIDAGRVTPLATAFLIGRGLAMTNRHVLTSTELAEACAIEMDVEERSFGPRRRPERYRLRPDQGFLEDADLDLAVVAVAAESGNGVPLERYGWIELIGGIGKIVIHPSDQWVNIVQHPQGRAKELVLRDNRLLDLTEADADDPAFAPFLHYEADTEKGSSGSPVFNDQWQLIALHHAGVPRRNAAGQPLRKDGEPWREGDPVEAVDWLGNEGIRVSKLVAHLEGKGWAERLGGRPPEPDWATFFADPPPERSASAGRTIEASAGAEALMVSSTAPAGTTSLTFHVPVTVTVGLGHPAGLAGPVVPVAPGRSARPVVAALEAEALPVAAYFDRPGYDPAFLGTDLPLPTLRTGRFGGLLAVRRSPVALANPNELKYFKYSVLMNSVRRLAYCSAVNIDFSEPEEAGREDGSKTWRLDSRIDPDDQADNRYYRDEDDRPNEYDRGHLTRRDDAARGRTKAEAIAANNDTFHYTNSAPQHFAFNRPEELLPRGTRPPPNKLWGELELHITAQAGAERITVFNGSVFGQNDKPFKDLLVPRAYYKIVVFKDENGLGALGFVLDQTMLIRDLPEEAIGVGEFLVHWRSIEAVETQTDLDFGRLRDFDRFGTGPGEESLGGEGIRLFRLGDLRF